MVSSGWYLSDRRCSSPVWHYPRGFSSDAFVARSPKASVSLRVHPSCALFAPRGPYGFGSPDSSLLQSTLTSRRPLPRFVSFALAVPSDVGVDEISQLSGKPVAYVPCSMTPVESASRPMLPSAFPDGVGLHTFFTGLNHTARLLAVYASAPGSPRAPQDSLPAVPSALAGRGWLPAGFQFEVSAHGSILLNQTLAGAPGRMGGREVREVFVV